MQRAWDKRQAQALRVSTAMQRHGKRFKGSARGCHINVGPRRYPHHQGSGAVALRAVNQGTTESSVGTRIARRR